MVRLLKCSIRKTIWYLYSAFAIAQYEWHDHTFFQSYSQTWDFCISVKICVDVIEIYNFVLLSFPQNISSFCNNIHRCTQGRFWAEVNVGHKRGTLLCFLTALNRIYPKPKRTPPPRPLPWVPVTASMNKNKTNRDHF